MGCELDHVDVPARKLGPHPRQHVVPRDLRQERRGRVRAPEVPRLLLRRWLRSHDAANGDDDLVRHARRGRCAESRASGAIAAVLGAFIVLYPSARIKTLVLVFFVGSLPSSTSVSGSSTSGRSELRALLLEGEQRWRRLLRARRRLPLRVRRHDEATARPRIEPQGVDVRNTSAGWAPRPWVR